MTQAAGKSPSRKRLGDFEIVRELGRGGMGIVYEARQVSLNRKVALKVLSGSMGLTAKAVIRFKREAEAAAKLHHTNIVPIYATGDEDGTHYYAMEMIDGPSVDQVIAHLRETQSPHRQPPMQASQTVAGGATTASELPAWALESLGHQASESRSDSTMSAVSSTSFQSGGGYFDNIARMMAEVADALDYAHAHSVVHRDIKPSNLLLSPEGRLGLNDFGLARMLEQPGMTVSGEFVGSPMYMSPEQTAAGRAPLDHRTDIYSLGATLYELLTLQPPFPGERRDQIIAQIMHKDPRPPRKINRKVPVDLETICLKAMEKDPDKRYQTAGDMARDLRNYVNRFAITARRVGPVGRLVRWARRSKAVAAMLVLAVLFGIIAAVAGYQAYRARQRLLDQMVDKAMAAAMCGDASRAEAAIREIELADGSMATVRTLRGLLAHRRMELPQAIEHLEQALRLAPDSVAAKALLATTYLTAARPEPWDRLSLELTRQEPKTPHDYLFKGFVISMTDPAAGIKDMDRAIELRDSAVARCMRAEAISMAAVDRADTMMAAKAIEDVHVARTLMQGEVFAVCASVRVHVLCASVYQLRGMQKERQAAIAQAGRDAEEAMSSPLPLARVMPFYYYDLIGDDQRALEALREFGYAAPIWGGGYGLALYRCGRVQEAINALLGEGPDSPAFIFDGAFILAETGEAGRDRAYAMYKARPREGDYMWTLYSHSVPLFLGRKAEAIQAYRDMRSRKPNWSWRDGWYEHVLDYLAGTTEPRDLLKIAGDSNFNRCEAHYWIALMSLSDGDRQTARSHFRQCVGTGVMPFVEYHFSRAFLARMDQDPAWPGWIPARNTTTQPAR